MLEILNQVSDFTLHIQEQECVVVGSSSHMGLVAMKPVFEVIDQNKGNFNSLTSLCS